MHLDKAHGANMPQSNLASEIQTDVNECETNRSMDLNNPAFRLEITTSVDTDALFTRRC